MPENIYFSADELIEVIRKNKLVRTATNDPFLSIIIESLIDIESPIQNYATLNPFAL